MTHYLTSMSPLKQYWLKEQKILYNNYTRFNLIL